MKVNFYISCETAEETQACLDFISDMQEIREARARGDLPKFTPKADVPIAAPLNDDEDNDPDELQRKNVSPGEPAIGKIGETAKLTILSDLANGMRPNTKYAEHLKLLWKRGEVKWDGQNWYL